VAAGVDYQPAGQVRCLREGTPVAALPQAARQVTAVHPAAAFYRREFLEMLGPAAAETGDRLATLDLALGLRLLGYRTVLEPRSRVTTAVRKASLAASFRRAMEDERFFWRWMPGLGRVRSSVAHGLMSLGECFATLPGPATVARWLGRLIGFSLPSRARRHRRRLVEWQSQVRWNAALSAARARRQLKKRPAA
jgi:hypothetical protein